MGDEAKALRHFITALLSCLYAENRAFVICALVRWPFENFQHSSLRLVCSDDDSLAGVDVLIPTRVR